MLILKRQKFGFVLGTAAFSLVCATPVHAAVDAAVQEQLRTVRKTSRGWVSVIVGLDGPLTPPQLQSLTALHADIYRNLPLIHSVSVRIPKRNLPALATLPFVKNLSADLVVRKNDAFTVGHSGADIAWSNFAVSGKNVGIAIIDSGIFLGHPDVAVNTNLSRVSASVSFVGLDPKTDPCGHGTHVAGLAAGNARMSTQPSSTRSFYGIAPNASLVSVQVLDGQGVGSVSSTVAGIQWAVANRAAYKIRVINLSLGHPVGESYTTDPLCKAVEAAWKSGIVVVCAAGNNGRLYTKQNLLADNEGWGTNYGSIQSPANDPLVITVGAMKSINGLRPFDRVATYSSRGPSRLDYVLKPDIMAPGNQVISLNGSEGKTTLSKLFGGTNKIKTSAFATTKYTIGDVLSDNAYYVLSGTSMAAPVVSGAAALLLSKDPTLSPDTIKARLMLTADKWTQPLALTGDVCTFGAGFLNIPAALSATTIVATRTAASPSLTRDSYGNILVDPSKAIWGTTSGTTAIWGVYGVQNYQAIWGTQAIWGNTATWGFALTNSQAIWGNTVWSDKAIWGTTSSAVDLTSIAIKGEN